MTNVSIKENSWLARIAAYKMETGNIAMVLGKTIYLYNASKEEFLRNKKWVRHEVAHVKQFVEHGYVRFIFLYLLESFNKGYENNSFEVDARAKEQDHSILRDVQFI